MKLTKFNWAVFYILNFVSNVISFVTRYHYVPCFDVKYLRDIIDKK